MAAVGRKLGHELREFALIFAYLYVCFGAIMLYKTAILRGQGIDYAPYGFAVIKALLLAKLYSMGHMARVGDRYERRRFIFVVAHKSLLFWFCSSVSRSLRRPSSGSFMAERSAPRSLTSQGHVHNRRKLCDHAADCSSPT